VNISSSGFDSNRVLYPIVLRENDGTYKMWYTGYNTTNYQIGYAVFPNSSASGWTTGNISGGLKFDRLDDYVDLGNASAFNISGNITVSAWIYPLNTLAMAVVGKRDTSGKINYNLWQSNGNITFQVSQTGLGRTVTMPIQANQWQHVVGTYNGGELRIWVNGISSSSYAMTGNIDTNIVSVLIGATRHQTYITPGNISNFYNGSIDDVRIYNRSLLQQKFCRFIRTIP